MGSAPCRCNRFFWCPRFAAVLWALTWAKCILSKLRRIPTNPIVILSEVRRKPNAVEEPAPSGAEGISTSTGSRGPSTPPNYFFFAAAFFAGAFFAAFFFAGFAAAVASSWASIGAAFFTFFSFLGSSGALNDCPSNAISVIRTAL